MTGHVARIEVPEPTLSNHIVAERIQRGRAVN
jgi:hypothetical protein